MLMQTQLDEHDIQSVNHRWYYSNSISFIKHYFANNISLNNDMGTASLKLPNQYTNQYTKQHEKSAHTGM